MERRLGRGLGSLLGGQTEQTSTETEAGEPQGPVRTLAIAEVRPNPNQPRKVFDSAALEELRDSIRNHGILQPCLLYTSPSPRDLSTSRMPSSA